MNDQDYKRLQRFIVITWSLLLFVVIGLTLWGSYEIRNLKELIQKPIIVKGLKGEQGIQGSTGQAGLSLIGPQGLQGTQGEYGLPGIPGVSNITYVQGPKGDLGEQGQQGDPGPPGRSIFVRQNPDTGILECQLANTLSWFPLEECSK